MECAATAGELDRLLSGLAPSQVVLMEPHLEFIRALEVHGAMRYLSGDDLPLDVLVLRYQESAEKF